MKSPIAYLSRTVLAILAACVAWPAAAQAIPRGGQNFLWEVSSLTNRIYLYGTVHAGKAAWFPLPKAVEEAFEDSAVLVVEADITDAAALAKTTTAMTYAAPDSLQKHVPPDEYARFVKLLPRYGLTEAHVSQMKPFMAVSLLVFSEWARNAYFPQFGIDAYLIRKARAELKPVVEIEGVAAQVELMASLTEAENRTLFAGTLAALESDLTSEQIKGMVAAWQAGDPQAMLDIARKYNERVMGAREFEEKFIWSRHDAMVKRIEAYLNGSRERHFVAVGSLHLAGPRGLVELLRSRGYMVRQK
ncbi:MAG TPA: TraB/GumN family protein [Usitatibacter sp.]|nr:TraB/GumN family protein [Usitatibacter sp.]